MNIEYRIKALKELLEIDWMNVTQAQTYADRSEASIYRLIRTGKLVTSKSKGGRTLISRKSIDEWQGGISDV